MGRKFQSLLSSYQVKKHLKLSTVVKLSQVVYLHLQVSSTHCVLQLKSAKLRRPQMKTRTHTKPTTHKTNATTNQQKKDNTHHLKNPSFNSSSTPKHKCNLSCIIPPTFQVEWILCLQNVPSQISLLMLHPVYKYLITDKHFKNGSLNMYQRQVPLP